MKLSTPESAILSAVIFNALIIVALIPLALRGVKYRPISANRVLSSEYGCLWHGRNNYSIYRYQAYRYAARSYTHGLILLIINELIEIFMKTKTIIALKFLLLMTILTGLIYPLLMTGVAQIIFPARANGSLILKDGRVIGSELIGQKFDSSAYFWSRPSAIDYNPVPSGASNYGPTSDTLKKLVTARRKFICENDFNLRYNVYSKRNDFCFRKWSRSSYFSRSCSYCRLTG